MKSYTTLRNLAGSLAKDTRTATLTLLDQFINDGYRIECGARDWPFLYKTDATMVTTASTQFKEMPNNVGRLHGVTVANGSNIITPKEAPSEDFWNELNFTTYTSDYPEYYFVRGKQLGLWPTPATSSNTITLYFKQLVKDLSIADVTSSTVTSISNGGTAMVINAGGAVSWAGRYIRITESDTANKGDGFWYEISAATATTITLVKAYQGTTIATGAAACIVGQMPLLPEAYHELPVWYALGEYWDLEGELA
ncbi:MAG TPA: hypothetical protein VEA37_09645, partial [Flavobacterium sp.]|nr:hypothetical protein [Flavobacterium sp.]